MFHPPFFPTRVLGSSYRRLLLSLILFTLLPGAQAADTVYTVTSTGTQNQSAATYTQTGTVSGHAVPDNTDIGNVLRYTTNSTATTLNLDQNLTLGGIRTNGSGALTIGVSAGTLTMDATGMTLNTTLGNPFGNFGNAFLAGTNSGGLLTVSAPIVIANTHLDIGNTAGVNTGVTISGPITASTAQTINLYGNGSGGLTLSGNVGASGSAIAIVNSGNSTASVILSGTFGPSVSTITQNSATSAVAISGTNTYSGGTILNAGSLTGSNAAATNVLRALGTGTVTLNGGTLLLRGNGTGSNQTIITGDGVTGNNVVVGGATTINVDRVGANATNTFRFNDLNIGANTLSVLGANSYKLQFAGTTTATGAATFNPLTAPIALEAVTIGDSVTTGTTTAVTLGGINTGNLVSGVISNNGTDPTKVLALTKNNLSTWTLNGATVNTYTGATSVNGGTLIVDFANLATPTNLINSASSLTLGGGTLNVKAKATGNTNQTLGNVTLTANSGQSAITLTAGGTSTNLILGNTWTRGAGTILNINAPATTTVSSGITLVNGLIGGYAVGTIGGSTPVFLTITGGVVAGASSMGLTASSNDATANFSASSTTVTHSSGNWAVNSLTLDGASLDIGGGILTLTSGGVLNRGTGTGTDAISNGQLGASGSEVVIHEFQNRTLEISATVSGGTGSLTKGGGSTNKVILSGNNSYTGNTVIGAGTLQIGNGGTSGDISSSANVIVAAGATLAYNATDASSVKNVTGGGIVSVNSGTLTLNQSGAGLEIRSISGLSGATIEFAGNGTGDTSLGSATAGTISYLNVAGMNYKFTSGTVNLLDNARGSTSNIEIAGATVNVVNNPFSMSGVASGTQTFTMSSGTLNANASNGVSGLNGGGGAGQSGVANSTFVGIQTGGTISVTNAVGRFDLGSTSAGNSTAYTLSGGLISQLGATNGMKLGADTGGLSTTTFNFSGGKLLQGTSIAGSQGSGAKQAFVWTGGTLATLAYDATNLTSTAGTAVVTGVTNTLTNAGGILAPGDIGTAGRTNITGNYAVTSANAIFAVDVGGSANSSLFQQGSGFYDQVTVSGTTALNGRLRFGLINSYTPPNDATTIYRILNGNTPATSTITGSFTNLMTATSGNSRVVGADGLSSFLVAINNTASTATIGGLSNLGARTVNLGGYQASNTYNAASGGSWDLANAAAWTNFDAGATASPTTQASGAIAQFADGALTGSGANTLTLNSARNLMGIQFASATAGHNYTINNAGSGSVILDNTANSAAATIADSSASGNVNAINVPITLQSDLAVSVTNVGTTVIVGGAISGTGRSLTKTGAGTLTLSGASTYTGATNVNVGTLIVNGSLSNSSLVTVATGAKLGGSGSIGNLLVQAGGTHAPGNSPGVQTVTGNAGYAAGSTFAWELADNVALSSIQGGLADFDQVQVNGNLSITTGALFTLTLNGSGSAVDFSDVFWAGNQQWLVFNVGGTGTGDFTLGSISTDSLGQNYAGYGNFELQNFDGDIYLNWNATAIPEPNTVALLGIGLGILVLRQRRRS